MTSKEYIKRYFYYLVPILAFLPQLFMSLNSFGQMRFEELIESVQAPFWFDRHQIISGLHVNVGWYALLTAVYKLFGFSLYTGRIVNLAGFLLSSFVLAITLKRFFDIKVASLILITILLSPTFLFINSESLHWAMSIQLMIIIVSLLILLDFRKKRLSLILTGLIFFLLMIDWFFYQAVVFYIPSLIIFYWLKYRAHLRGVSLDFARDKKAHPGGVRLAVVAVVAFLAPLIMLFVWVENRQVLIYDAQVGSGLFRGGGSFVLSDVVFSQAWSDFISDFFVRGVSHHFEVAQGEFSLGFPVVTLALVFWLSISNLRHLSNLRYLAFLVIVFNAIIFSITSDLGMPGMKRLTPMLASIYFLWVLCWYYMVPRFRGDDKTEKRVKLPIPEIIVIVILSFLPLHHLSVYPANLAAIREQSPFKVTDWFDENNPQKSVEEYVEVVKKQDLVLDCRQHLRQGGSCFYDFIYPAVSGSCEWNRLSCHKIYGYDPESGQFKELSI